MTLSFNINYRTFFGEQIYITGNTAELGSWNEDKAVPLDYLGNGLWRKIIDTDSNKTIEYCYFKKNKYSGDCVFERGSSRTIETKEALLYLEDQWKAPDGNYAVYHSSLFGKVLHQRKSVANTPKKAVKNKLRIQINAPQVAPHQTLYLCGSSAALGEWNPKRSIPMNDSSFPLWTCDLPAETLNTPAAYKFILKDGDQIIWEDGDNRKLEAPATTFDRWVISNESLKIHNSLWRGAGVSIPVFSLRTQNSYGVGEFLDLKQLSDWAANTGMHMIQLLPINDTTVHHTWLDSYPYKPISVFALHPMYLNVEALNGFTAADKKKYKQEKTALNQLKTVDYETVNKNKITYLKKIFNRQKETFLESEAFKEFFDHSRDWLPAYAAFCYLRDLNGNVDFDKWGAYQKFSSEKLSQLTSPKFKDYDQIAFHYFVQFHLDKQLKEAVAYARNLGVALKGDIPIGIGGESVDAWTQPHLFNLGTAAGAPPDDFAVKGQNWGFPTYNWEEMEKENFKWWKNRFAKMADFFDAYRIDHILGFFRIWEIPPHAVWGLLGYFNKALPYSVEELNYRGIGMDYDRYCKPYIRTHILYEIFGNQTQEVIEQYLQPTGELSFELKEKFNTQKKIETYFENLGENADENLKEKLMGLLAEVLFIEDPASPGLFHPRISIHNTLSYRDLDNDLKHNINELYEGFFYHRNNDFWEKEAMRKLPMLVNSTDMLVCGEDLGMVPDCVPDVMWNLKILSLEIQRMPKDPSSRFGHPADAPYMSVCTPSTHDMSTIRGWWEEDTSASQEFFNTILGNWGASPFYAEPWVCREIIEQHLYSPAMLTVFPLQDLMAIDGDLRSQDTQGERINVPSNPKHYWCYRMHLDIEDLEKATDFNNDLKALIAASGR